MIRRPTSNISKLLLSAILLFPSISHSEEQIRIGVSAPLTGEAATYGIDLRNSLQYANSQLGNKRYKLFFEDDKCSGLGAVNAANKFVNIDKVDYVLGFGCSGAVLSSAPVYEAAKTLTIAAGTSSPAITQAGDYIFRTCPSDVSSSRVLFEHISKKHKSIGVVSEETDFCQTLSTAFSKQNKGKQLLIYSDNFLPGTTDFKTTLLKLKAKNPEALFLNTQAERTLAVLVRQLSELKWQVPLYAIYWPSSPSFLKAVDGKAEGMIFADLPGSSETLTGEGQKYYKDFIKEYGPMQSSDYFFYLAFSSFQALDQAIRSGETPKDYLYKSEFPTLMGNISFDSNGDVLGFTHVLKVIKNGQPQLLN